MSKILVTGAGGYIGTTLVPMLLERGHSVRALDRYFFGKDLIDKSARLEILIEDSRKTLPSHFRDVDVVIDLVAISNDPSGELFQKSTWEINHESRVRNARLAKEEGVSRYVFPSSCSIYGFREEICKEDSEINPLTTYAKANRAAERDVLTLSDNNFTVVVLRQATVFGYSPRMRFDLAINGMTYGAWSNNKLPLMRDGKQWRPMLHVKDAARAQIFFSEYTNVNVINGQIFNIGSDSNCYQLGPLAELISSTLPIDISIEWYGDPDDRSYRVSFDKVESLGWKAKYNAAEASLELYQMLDENKLTKKEESITLDWYKKLHLWRDRIRRLEMYGGLLEID